MTEHVLAWVGPALDLAALGLLAMVLWRLGRDPGAGWAERESKLQAIFDDLRALVAQSEGVARDLDAKLAGREARLRALLEEAETALGVEPGSGKRDARATDATVARAASTAPANATPSATATTAPAPEEIAERIEELAEAGAAVEDIARRVGVAPAEVRLVIGLKAARLARRRAAGSETRAHA